jgi:dienelactone hydrolase
MTNNRRDGEPAGTTAYDPFARGPFPVGVRTVSAVDETRKLTLPCELWYPATADHTGQDCSDETRDAFTVPPLDVRRLQAAVRDASAEAGPFPAIAYSHPSGGNRRSATFLCTHLASHGYVVGAVDHTEAVAPELARRPDETPDEKAARVEAWVANRPSDVRAVLDRVLADPSADASRVGAVGHSFGGWTVLAAVDVEPRIGAVVALAPAGASNPKPGMLRASLAFAWERDVPTLFLVADGDVCLPLSGMVELYERTPATKRMFVLRRADHMHFMDDVEAIHEGVRSMEWPGELAWLP